MLTNQQREFRRLGFELMMRLWKLHGHLVWLMEKNQNDWRPTGDDVDAFYERLFNLFDAIERFKRGDIWRSVDVVDEDSDELDDK